MDNFWQYKRDYRFHNSLLTTTKSCRGKWRPEENCKKPSKPLLVVICFFLFQVYIKLSRSVSCEVPTLTIDLMILHSPHTSYKYKQTIRTTILLFYQLEPVYIQRYWGNMATEMSIQTSISQCSLNTHVFCGMSEGAKKKNVRIPLPSQIIFYTFHWTPDINLGGGWIIIHIVTVAGPCDHWTSIIPTVTPLFILCQFCW